jgi:HrpA-like RNA helicase
MKRARPEAKQSSKAKPTPTAKAQAEWKAIQDSRRLLPVFTQRKEIIGAIVQSRVVILVGETGSGKTTQLPQFLLEERNILGSKQAIAVTQPRRVAAVSIATRVAAERKCDGQVGHEVGYTIRFDDCTRKQTRLKYVTDGMLLREAMVDRSLLKYGVIILDEAHERTCNTDILFGVVKDALRRRSDLRVVVMRYVLIVQLYA